MNTFFLIMAHYNVKAVITLEDICRDYFMHLTPEMFQRKVLAGQIKIPLMRIECSQKSTKGIHLSDLAAYLDKRHAEALEEYQKLNGVRRIG